jgi:hypothetical protein
MIIALNAIPVHYIYENPPWFDRYPLRNVSSRTGRNAFALSKQQAIDALNQLSKWASLVINTEAAEKANEIKSGTMPTPTPEATIAPTPEPTATPTPEATATSEPTATPEAAPTPEPTATPTPEWQVGGLVGVAFPIFGVFPFSRLVGRLIFLT